MKFQLLCLALLATQASPPSCAAKHPSVRRRLDASGTPVMSTVSSLTGKFRQGVRQPHTPHCGSWEHRELYSCLLKALLALPTGGHVRSPAPHSLRSLLPQNSATSLCPSPPHAPPAAYCPLGSQPLKRLSLRPFLRDTGPPSGITGLQGSQQQHHLGVFQTDAFPMPPSASIEKDQSGA